MGLPVRGDSAERAEVAWHEIVLSGNGEEETEMGGEWRRLGGERER